MENEKLADIEIELLTLSNAMLDKSARLKIVSELHKEDFYRETHRLLFDVLQDMTIHDEDVDISLVADKLKGRNELERIGNIPFLMQVANASPTTAYTDTYIKKLKTFSERRQTVEDLQVLQGKAADLSLSAEHVRALCQAVRAIMGKPVEVQTEHMKSIKDVYLEVFNELDEEIRNPESKKNGIQTGLKDLDEQMGSMKPKELHVIAGKTGNGKSALALTIALNAALAGKTVLYCGLEMSNGETVKRAIARAARVDGKAIYNPSLLTAKNWQSIAGCGERLASLPIFFDDSTSLSPLAIKRKAMELKQVTGKGVDLLIIDYLQLMTAGMRKENRTQEVSYITRSLKNLAGELDCVILLLSQVNRNSDHDNRGLRLSDLRDSGTIEQDANGVIFVSRDVRPITDDNGNKQTENLLTSTLDIAKSRKSAANKKIRVTYLAKYYLFRDFSSRDEPTTISVNRHQAKVINDITRAKPQEIK